MKLTPAQELVVGCALVELALALPPSAGRDFAERLIADEPLAPDFTFAGALALLCALQAHELNMVRLADWMPCPYSHDAVNEIAEMCEILTDAIGALP